MNSETSLYLEDHIDAPIKKSVAGLALLGLRPIMSCCGFSYENEAVPKTHLKKAYVYLSFRKGDDRHSYGAILLDLAARAKWTIGPGRECFDGLIIYDFYGETWKDGHPWGNESSIHNYEIFLLAINALNEAIETVKHRMFDSFLLEDGNNLYANLNSFWKYKPTKPWLVTKQIWENLPK